MKAICLVFCFFFVQGHELPPPCESEIYCTGELLRQVQMAKLFTDNKHFVDMRLLSPPDEVLAAFHQLASEAPGQAVPRDKLQEFVKRFFDEPGKELQPWTPPDWHDKPSFLSKIKDPNLYTWADELHLLWKSLGRTVSKDVKSHSEQYSYIYTPNPVIVPGGRFRELYYWDTFWVIDGLLVCDMKDTARGMIENFIYLIDKYGFVPNGNRIYYERRSQPPFLTAMVRDYYQATKDEQFLRKALPALEKEYNFWMTNRSVVVAVNGTNYTLNHYNVQVDGPRPEAYSVDAELAELLPEEEKIRLYTELKAGAESGWDYSSRWFVGEEDSPSAASLKDTHTSAIVPTDLNSFLCLNEFTLAFFHRELGNHAAAKVYEEAHQLRQAAVEAVLWDPDKGAWFDYNTLTNSRNAAFYPSNLAPLWAHCFRNSDMQLKAFNYLKDSGALDYHYGVPTSFENSGEQWDMPNGWPPLQHMLIQGLADIPLEESKELAFQLAQKWITTNWAAYTKYEAMFEKYDVNSGGKPGGGGEYDVQLGFGWTNGVALRLLNQYGDRLESAAAPLNASSLIWVQFLLLLILLIQG
ncbi:trehalase [Engraulis encrasicolus]|uniref:trehalase n=1 Tax=Engraulis encrasicolus TaxID=184585 RepID=UPI002FD38A53